MDRRKVLSLAAMIPFVGGITPAASAPLPNAAPPTRLSAVRDDILPAVRAFGTADMEFDVLVDFDADAILVKGWNRVHKRGLGFAIGRDRIARGVYRAELAPNMRTLSELLAQPPEA